MSGGGSTERSQSGSESTTSTAHSGADHNETQSTSDGDSPTTTEAESTLATSETADATDNSGGNNNPTDQGETPSNNKSTSQDSETTYTGDDGPVVKSASGTDGPKDAADDDDVDPIKKRHMANRKSADELDAAVNPEGGVPINEVMEDMNSDDSHDRFRTYEEPEADDGDYDPDREAVKQFVAGFCVVDEDRKDELKMSKNQLFNSFTTWAEINNPELDELSGDVYVDMRKGNLNDVLTDLFNVMEDRMDIDGKRVRAVGGIELSDSGYELLNIDYTE